MLPIFTVPECGKYLKLPASPFINRNCNISICVGIHTFRRCLAKCFHTTTKLDKLNRQLKRNLFSFGRSLHWEARHLCTNSLPSVVQLRKSFRKLRETEYSPESFTEVLEIIDNCMLSDLCILLFEITFIHIFLQVIRGILELLPEKERSRAILMTDKDGQTILHQVAMKKAYVSIH